MGGNRMAWPARNGNRTSRTAAAGLRSQATRGKPGSLSALLTNPNSDSFPPCGQDFCSLVARAPPQSVSEGRRERVFPLLNSLTTLPVLPAQTRHSNLKPRPQPKKQSDPMGFPKAVRGVLPSVPCQQCHDTWYLAEMRTLRHPYVHSASNPGGSQSLDSF